MTNIHNHQKGVPALLATESYRHPIRRTLRGSGGRYVGTHVHQHTSKWQLKVTKEPQEHRGRDTSVPMLATRG